MIQILINQLDFFVFFKNKQFEITVDSILEFMLFLEMNTGLIFPNNEHRISLKTQIISNLKSIKNYCKNNKKQRKKHKLEVIILQQKTDRHKNC